MEALDKAIRILGSLVAVGAVCNVSKGAVSQWKDEGRRIPAEHCPLIERATNGAVRCEELRPDVAWDVLRMQAGMEPATEQAVVGG